MLRKHRLLFFPEPDATGGGVDDEKNAPPPREEESTTEQNDEESGEIDDDFYNDPETGKPPEKKGKEDKKDDSTKKPESEKPKADDEKPAPVAGYDLGEPEEEEDVEPEPIPPEEPIKVKEELGFELDFKDVDPADAKKVVEFAKNNKLSEEHTKAFLEMRKKETSELKAAKEKELSDWQKAVDDKKKAWQKELKEDKEFGGDNYKASMAQVAKVLDLMPGTKEQLTKSGQMLPAYVMKDLSALGKELFKTESLVQGDPTSKEKDESPEDFYKDHDI